MTTPLLSRFQPMLGFWRGPNELETGRRGLMEMHFQSHFEGEVVQLDAHTWDIATGETFSAGTGLFALGPDGRIIENLYVERFGFCRLDETEDEPDVLALRGDLPDGFTMSVSLRLEADELLLTSQLKSGVVGMDLPRTVARLRRYDRQRGEGAK
ncbi:MAG: hypothetical protein KDB90_15110 [Planctomycetes bacterium]|nr:hypothetical protein [Planctomycetota bacterium]